MRRGTGRWWWSAGSNGVRKVYDAGHVFADNGQPAIHRHVLPGRLVCPIVFFYRNRRNGPAFQPRKQRRVVTHVNYQCAVVQLRTVCVDALAREMRMLFCRRLRLLSDRCRLRCGLSLRLRYTEFAKKCLALLWR